MLIDQGTSTGVCTGWLIADADGLDCLITAEHCELAAGDKVQFNYECTKCELDGVCKPIYEYTVAAVVASNAELDYSVVQVHGDPATTWGVLPVNPDVKSLFRPRAMRMFHHSGGKKKGYFAGSATGYASDDGIFNALEYVAPTNTGASGSPC